MDEVGLWATELEPLLLRAGERLLPWRQWDPDEIRDDLQECVAGRLN